jgi:3-oxoacyl-[acyl-carrier protein] reductase
MSDHRPLQGRVALVTGVSRRIGIGTAITQRLLSDGASVLVSGFEPHDREMPWATDAGGAREVLARHAAAAERLHHHEDADFEDPETADRLVAATIDRFGDIDIVVANHARSSLQPFEAMTADELDKCWAINARGSLLLAKSLHDRRPVAPGGRLVLFTSGQHIAPMPSEIAYAVSKGAIHQMTATLSDAMIDRGITVNCINPGPTDTGYAEGRVRTAVEQRFPALRWGTTQDVAKLVAWLVSDEAAWITGQVHISEGGWRRWARLPTEG